MGLLAFVNISMQVNMCRHIGELFMRFIVSCFYR